MQRRLVNKTILFILILTSDFKFIKVFTNLIVHEFYESVKNVLEFGTLTARSPSSRSKLSSITCTCSLQDYSWNTPWQPTHMTLLSGWKLFSVSKGVGVVYVSVRGYTCCTRACESQS